MTTETIDIRIREDGAVVVKRNIESIAPAAQRSAGAVDFLKKALLGIGGAAAAREVLRLADSYTNLLNRLRSTGLEAGNLTGVYQALLKVSNDTRSSVEGSVELYSRLAVSSKELGVSQQQLIDFTKSLNQAVILSGASATEANAAIIQLSQGLSSGTLRGDELRSVLEQLPAVADVIAKGLGVTRGQLRKLGEDGKITGQAVLKAFQDARGELEERFGKTVPTLSQSFQVLKNNFVDFIGRVDASTGITAAFSKAIFAIAKNLDTVVYAIVGLASGLLVLGSVQLAIAGVTRAVQALTVAVAANPIGALLVVLTSAIVSLTLFRDRILLGVDGVTTLGDLMRAFGEQVGKVFSTLGNAAETLFGPLIKSVRDWFSATDISVAGVLRLAAKAVDFFIGAWRGAVYATVAIFEGVPPALSDIFTRALNFILGKISLFVNKTGELLSSVTEFVGLGKIASNFDWTLTNKDAGAASRLGGDIASAFSEGFKAATPAKDFLDGMFNRAVELGQNRKLQEQANAGYVSSRAGTAVRTPVDGKEIDKATNALRALLNQILPSAGATLELAKAQRTLSDAQRLGLITAAQHTKYLELAKRYYEDAINPLGKYNRELDEQIALLRVNSKEREVESQLLSITKDLRQQGIDLTTAETTALREKLQLLRDTSIAQQAQDQLLAATVGQRQAYVDQLKAINALLSDPASGFTKGDAATSVNAMAPELFAGTQTAIDAQLASFQSMYAQIDALRQADLISEQTAAVARTRIAIMQNEARLAGTKDFFANLASLSSSGNKRIAAIGKAAAVAQATIDGVLAVQKALAAPPGWPYNAPQVIAVGISAAANVAKLAGFSEGGYTGNMGVGKIAGVVHGQEYVVNAEATSRNRATLEAMNSGATIGTSGQLNVGIVINTPPGTTARAEERDTPDGKQIEITIAEVVTKQVRRGGMIADAIESQYGLNRATGAAR